MKPYYADGWLTLYGGDCREVLRELPSDSVDCVVTSPPYWGLRDYGTATWEGGDAECDHVQRTNKHGGTSNRPGLEAQTYEFRDTCGAVRIDSQLGLERTPEEYVANMVEVFREVRRVLKPSGTCWLNLGDSYSTHAAGMPLSGDPMAASTLAGVNTARHSNATARQRSDVEKRGGLPEKNLVGIPWRVAFALQADGWVLRSEIIWNKPNPMPESVTDRPTKSHEQLFLLTKAKRVGPEPTKYDDISDADAQWIAGLLDCEGSIVIRREQPTPTGQQHAAQVSIGSTSRELLERVAAIVGDGSVLERAGQNAPMHYWQQGGKRAMGLLRRLYPYLIVKQRQARCAIALEERKWVRGGHKQLPAAEIAWREKVWEAVKALNHFGNPDLSDVPEPSVSTHWVELVPHTGLDPHRVSRRQDVRGMCLGVPGDAYMRLR